MTRKTALVALLLPACASAHRLDEYLQATLLSIQPDRVQAELRLTPGVAALPLILPAIDTNNDGLVSPSEQHTYAQRVLADLQLRLDGNPLALHLVSAKFPGFPEMQAGLGEILIEFTADVPRGPGRSRHTLTFENHHQAKLAAYLVNCLKPDDPRIRLAAQTRNELQSAYQLDYDLEARGSAGVTGGEWSIATLLLLLLGVRLALHWLRANRSLNPPPLGAAQ